MDDAVLGLCACCSKQGFKSAQNWRSLTADWATQLEVDFEKAHAAAGPGFMGLARLCSACRRKKTKKPAFSGKNGRKGQGKGNGKKRKVEDVEQAPSVDFTVVECGICSVSVEPDKLRRWQPSFSRAINFKEHLEMACMGCVSHARKKYRYSGGSTAPNSPHKTRGMVPSDFLQQLKELKDQMEVLRGQLQSEAELRCTYQRALGFKNAAKKISELTDLRSQRTR